MIRRLDQLTGPLEAGKHYLVPTVHGMWQQRVRDWPVIGVRHNDAHCLQFEHQHYHLDGRFLRCFWLDDEYWFWRNVGGSPLMLDAAGKLADLSAPTWRRRKCQHVTSPSIDAVYGMVADNAARFLQWRCHFDEWTGKQASHDGRGWVCPHRKVPLADHAPVDGVITCPLHFLRIDAATGKVLPPLLPDVGVPA